MTEADTKFAMLDKAEIVAAKLRHQVSAFAKSVPLLRKVCDWAQRFGRPWKRTEIL
ncbi:MAG: hypothetical protein ACHQAY_22200 [Hyphomicrobiales bacterium]